MSLLMIALIVLFPFGVSGYDRRHLVCRGRRDLRGGS
jgi:hypothetical protein